MRSPLLSALERSNEPLPPLGRPPVPGLTPGLEICPVPLGWGPCFLLSIPLFPPSRAWKSAHKPEHGSWSLLTADTLPYSLTPDYISQCHLCLRFSVPAPPDLEICHLPCHTGSPCLGDYTSSVSVTPGLSLPMLRLLS